MGEEIYTFQCKRCKYSFKSSLKTDNLERPVMPKCPKCEGNTIILDFWKDDNFVIKEGNEKGGEKVVVG